MQGGQDSIPGQETRSCMLQLEIPRATTKITEPVCCNQDPAQSKLINIFKKILKLTCWWHLAQKGAEDLPGSVTPKLKRSLLHSELEIQGVRLWLLLKVQRSHPEVTECSRNIWISLLLPWSGYPLSIRIQLLNSPFTNWLDSLVVSDSLRPPEL